MWCLYCITQYTCITHTCVYTFLLLTWNIYIQECTCSVLGKGPWERSLGDICQYVVCESSTISKRSLSIIGYQGQQKQREADTTTSETSSPTSIHWGQEEEIQHQFHQERRRGGWRRTTTRRVESEQEDTRREGGRKGGGA